MKRVVGLLRGCRSSLRRIIRVGWIWMPTIMLILLIGYARYSTRLSLIVGGYPFAHVVPKDTLDVFQYVSTDNLRSSAIVFSNEKAVGWIYLPLFGPPHLVKFTNKPGFDDPGNPGFDLMFDGLLPMAWYYRWWLLAAQAFVLLSCFLSNYDAAREARRYRDRHLCRVCGYDLRATPERCPECGTIPPAPKGPAT